MIRDPHTYLGLGLTLGVQRVLTPMAGHPAFNVAAVNIQINLNIDPTAFNN